MQQDTPILHNCLYFTANALSRVITRMAEREFMTTGLSPSHAFLVLLADEAPGITQKELAQALQLAPSTVTRFIDGLMNRGLLTRKVDGKTTRIYPTEAGQALQQPIQDAWCRLHDRYAEVLGRKAGDKLTAEIDKASLALAGK